MWHCGVMCQGKKIEGVATLYLSLTFLLFLQFLQFTRFLGSNILIRSSNALMALTLTPLFF